MLFFYFLFATYFWFTNKMSHFLIKTDSTLSCNLFIKKVIKKMDWTPETVGCDKSQDMYAWKIWVPILTQNFACCKKLVNPSWVWTKKKPKPHEGRELAQKRSKAIIGPDLNSACLKTPATNYKHGFFGVIDGFNLFRV